MRQLLKPHLQEFKPYQSARSCQEGDSNKQSAQEFNFKTLNLIDANELDESFLNSGNNRYPSQRPVDLFQQTAKFWNVQVDEIIIDRGGDGVIDLLCRAFVGPGDRVLSFGPTYGVYKVNTAQEGGEYLELPISLLKKPNELQSLLGNTETKNPKIVFLCNPNNPSGEIFSKDLMLKMLRQFSDSVVVVDEAYMDFANADESVLKEIQSNPNLLVLKTLSKAHGMAGLRVGFGFGCPELIECLRLVQAPYPLSNPQIDLACEYFANFKIDSFAKRIESIQEGRDQLIQTLKSSPICDAVFESAGNFVLAKFKNPSEVFSEIKKQGFLIRDFSQKTGLEKCLRLTLPGQQDLVKLLKIIKEIK